MRLLWLAASMKNLDVILVLLPTDSECLEVCHLISEAMPLVEQARRQRWSKPPQVIVSLRDDAAAAKLTASLTPPPLVVGPTLALPRLICEVLPPQHAPQGTEKTDSCTLESLHHTVLPP